MAKKPMMNAKKDMKNKDKMSAKTNGLTAAQKKLPAGLQAAILKKKKK
jgi:hypothetical protein